MKNDVKEKIDILGSIGSDILSERINFESVVQSSLVHNRWYTPESIRSALDAVAINYLNADRLKSWLSPYIDSEIYPRQVGLILAGNIPMVGFHDVLSVLLSGHSGLVKLSDKDRFLIPALVDIYEHRYKSNSGIIFVEKLKDFDAIIATGSNNTARYFEEYFSHFPHIIRKNRSGVAVLDGTESFQDLLCLGKDIFTYFGLGCRNISKIYVPHDYNFDTLFTAFEHYREVINHNKYKNNFDYHYSVSLLNRDIFFTNDFILLKESSSIASPISVLNFEYYTEPAVVEDTIRHQDEQIQLVVSKHPIGKFRHYSFGNSQTPSLSDYADGVDTLDFLFGLDKFLVENE